MPNILETIVELCKSELGAADIIQRITALADTNAEELTQILDDFVSQNEPNPTYQKARLDAAKRMRGF